MEVHAFATSLPAANPRPGPPVLLELMPGLLDTTQKSLRHGSDGRREAICLWAGRASGNGSALISHLIEPVFFSTDRWLTVPPAERLLVSQFLRRERLLMFADIHTHPRRAFLSELDRARPFSVRDGFYAGVVPDFAAGGPGEAWRLYEVLSGVWDEVETRKRIRG